MGSDASSFVRSRRSPPEMGPGRRQFTRILMNVEICMRRKDNKGNSLPAAHVTPSGCGSGRQSYQQIWHSHTHRTTAGSTDQHKQRPSIGIVSGNGARACTLPVAVSRWTLGRKRGPPAGDTESTNTNIEVSTTYL